MKKSMQYQIFISYRSDMGKQMAEYLYEVLTSIGYIVFFDRNSLRSGPFDEAIYRAIDDCKALILVLSSDTLDERIYSEEDWIQKEILYACNKNKKIIPIFLGDFFDFPDKLPEKIDHIRKMNGIDLKREEYPIEKIMDFLDFKPSILNYWLINRYRKKETGKRKISFIFKITILFMMIYYTILTIIHYTYKDSWKLPRIMKHACYLLSTTSVDIIFIIFLGGIIVVILLCIHFLKGEVYYMRRKYKNRDLNEIDFFSSPHHILAKMGYEFPTQYEKNDYNSEINIQGEFKYYKRMKGLTIVSLEGNETDYIYVNIRDWPKLTIFYVGLHNSKNNIIRLLCEQGFQSCEIRKEYLSFKREDINLRLVYEKYRLKEIEVSKDIFITYINKMQKEFAKELNVEEITEEMIEELTGLQGKTDDPILVYLQNENGTYIEFELLDIISIGKKNYHVLVSNMEIGGFTKDSVLILEEKDGEYAETSDWIIQVVYGIFKEKNKERFDFGG